MSVHVQSLGDRVGFVALVVLNSPPVLVCGASSLLGSHGGGDCWSIGLVPGIAFPLYVCWLGVGVWLRHWCSLVSCLRVGCTLLVRFGQPIVQVGAVRMFSRRCGGIGGSGEALGSGYFHKTKCPHAYEVLVHG